MRQIREREKERKREREKKKEKRKIYLKSTPTFLLNHHHIFQGRTSPLGGKSFADAAFP